MLKHLYERQQFQVCKSLSKT